MRVWGMRTGISFSVRPADLDRLFAVVKDRSAPQKHVWRARIVLLSAEGAGTNAIMRETGRSKSVADLQAAINRFLDDHNAQSKPFQWVANPDKIIAAVRRGHQALDSIQ